MIDRFKIGFALDRRLEGYQRMALVVGGVLLLLSIAGVVFNPAEFFRSYLFSYLVWLGLSLGSMAIVMMQYLTGGAWGTIARRPLEAAMRNLPLLALLFVPLLFGIHYLYPWSHPDIVAASEPMRHRSGYMNAPFFIVRAVVYFAIWNGLAALLARWSRREDTEGTQHGICQRLSAPGLIVYVCTVTLSAIDWTESLSGRWASTMWGFLFVAGQGLAAFAFVIGVLYLLRRESPMAEIIRPSHMVDLGKLLFAFVMLWTYFSFSQLLIVWAGDLANEISFYLPRWHGGWPVVGFALLLLEFVIPFVLLLSRSVKQNARMMLAIVSLILFMRFVDLYWVVEPSSKTSGPHLSWLNLVLPVGLGGIWLWGYLRNLRQLPLMPAGAVNLENTLHHHGKA